MKVIELAGDNRFMQALRDRQADADRVRALKFPGLHLSTITQDYLKTAYPDRYTRQFEDETRAMYYEWGNLVEDVLANEMRDRISGWEKPEPVQCEGIWCSADGESSATDTIDEMKACFASAFKFLESVKFLGYKLQLLAYLYAYERSRGRLAVTFMNGDWRPPVPWPPKIYILKPTEREIRENWRNLKQHAKDRRLL